MKIIFACAAVGCRAFFAAYLYSNEIWQKQQLSENYFIFRPTQKGAPLRCEPFAAFSQQGRA
ncbi:MAG: hypothetical protein ACI4MK_05580 [Aristaeellaceae bacterium]